MRIGSGLRLCQPSSSAEGRLRRPKAEAFFGRRYEVKVPAEAGLRVE